MGHQGIIERLQLQVEAKVSGTGGLRRMFSFGPWRIKGKNSQRRRHRMRASMFMKTELCDTVLDLRPFSVYVLQSVGRRKAGKPKDIPGDLPPAPGRNIFQGFGIDDFSPHHRLSSNLNEFRIIRFSPRYAIVLSSLPGRCPFVRHPPRGDTNSDRFHLERLSFPISQMNEGEGVPSRSREGQNSSKLPTFILE
jgi:hypothetical protein